MCIFCASSSTSLLDLFPTLSDNSFDARSLFVNSGSMEPAFFRGDLLFLTNHQEEPIKVGDIVVFKIEGRDIPIVHRVLQLHNE